MTRLALIDLKFGLLLLGGLLLEMAGYIAFPYISLQLRDRFALAEASIGMIFLVALWLRPVWSLFGGYLSERVRPLYILAAACLAESACFLLLGTAKSAVFAAVAVVIGNMGFSLWNPNLFALVYKWYPNQTQTARVLLLNGAVNGGAAVGCLIRAFSLGLNSTAVFLGAGALYVVCIPLLGYSVRQEAVQPKVAKSFALGRVPWKLALTISVIAVGFWASYAQFNSFFALFANDWLKQNEVTGIAFGSVATGVGLLSIATSRLADLKIRLPIFTLGSAAFLCLGWILIPMGLWGTTGFLISLIFAETFYSTFLAEAWAAIAPNREHLMQAVNFSVRNVAMGLGSFLGGYAYHAPGISQTLQSWQWLNVILVSASLLAVICLMKTNKMGYR